MTARSVQHGPAKQGLKRAYEASVDALGGPRKAAGYSRANERWVSDYQRPNVDAFAPIDVVMDQEAVTVGTPGWPHVTAFLAAATGHTLVKLPDLDAMLSEAGSIALLCTAMAEQSREHGEAQTGLLAAMADHRLTRAEIEAALAAQDELIEANVRLRAVLAHMQEAA